jgi:excisionase family DNA binding protein
MLRVAAKWFPAQTNLFLRKETNMFQARSPEEQTQKLGLSLIEVAALLGLSSRTVFTLTKRGEIPHTRFGKRIIYSREKIVAMLNGEATTDAKSKD